MTRSPLVWISDVCTVLFGAGQMFVIIQQPAGQSVSWYLSFWLFCVVALTITLQELKLHPSDGARNRRWAYGLWSTVATTTLVASVIMKLVTDSELWSEKDTLNFTIYGTATAVVLIGARFTGRPLHDTFVRGWTAFALKALPQFFLAWHMLAQPDVSPALLAIVTGLTTMTIRAILIGNPFQIRTWNEQQKALAIAEYPNVISWASVGVVWCIHFAK